jgi:hypothetical protein
LQACDSKKHDLTQQKKEEHKNTLPAGREYIRKMRIMKKKAAARLKPAHSAMRFELGVLRFAQNFGSNCLRQLLKL